MNSVAEINLERAAEGMPTVEVDCLTILNDIDPNAANELSATVAPVRAAAKEDGSHVTLDFEINQVEFEALVDQVVAKVKKRRFRNVIYNLDRCGHNHVRRETITRLVRSGRSVEVFYTPPFHYELQYRMRLMRGFRCA